ncbi:TetR/AcrR family transcriptional regulator [Frankia sp. AgKG'84/4]|uniref:TetR/AcrR family transcriptional regulator n=1 Tax=Frankia sp. AgKG'84/4 TaxID=573490 RepID=UPI0020101651|nr:TetR/AcrR family transcriptional regulator [Frankia sp. AgKG'84/4]MCL9794164.1 TetR/AcrR family transcriptional regulator [Frankia sp. AgKG'84/4]
MSTVRAPAARTASRGRIDKRQAILDAAFTVFASQGYEQASVKNIADAAHVAKTTVYSHLEDKEQLFRLAMAAAAESVLAASVDVLDRLRAPGDDLRAAFEDVARALLQVCCGERSRALRWLTYGQVARFPDLIDTVQGRTSVHLAEALADRLARLSLTGRIRTCDPALAADQLLALLTGPAETRSRMGTREIPVEEIDVLARSAVDTFLRAYAAEN